jgi:hypothetical protein
MCRKKTLTDIMQREKYQYTKNKINKLETELSSYLGNEHDMTDDNIRLRNQVELLKGETKLAKDQLRKLQDNHDLIVSQQRSSYTDDTFVLKKKPKHCNEFLVELLVFGI